MKKTLKSFKEKIGIGITKIRYCLTIVTNFNLILSKKLSWHELLFYCYPEWYHNFKILGIKTFQKKGGYKEAQEQKQNKIFKYIDEGILQITDKSNIRGVELFCADGFYSNYSVQQGVSRMVGIDACEDSGEGKERFSVLDQANFITTMLGNKNKVSFVKDNVFNLNKEYDFALCLGGLYHISDPQKLIVLLRKHIKSFLVIQTIVSLENEDENYFISPCPGWTWGCRFSHSYLVKMVKEANWTILKECRNEIQWNKRLCDKGSSYLLCK